MEIIDARWETTEERDRRVVFFDATNRKDNSFEWINNNYQKMILDYKEFCKNYLIELHLKRIESYEQNVIDVNENNKTLDEIKNGVIKYCKCGGIINFIESHNFAGCENYRNKSIRHDYYNYKQYFQRNEDTIIVGKNYLNEFKKRYKIPAMVSHIFKTLKTHGCTILNEELTEEYYNTAKNNSFESKSQEAIVKGILQNKFKKVYFQQAIKIFDGKIWTTKIPDYICINDHSIYVFDAKLKVTGINEMQLALYHEAIKIIAKKSNIDKPVKSFFIIYEPNEYSEEKMISLKCFNSSTLDTYEFN